MKKKELIMSIAFWIAFIITFIAILLLFGCCCPDNEVQAEIDHFPEEIHIYRISDMKIIKSIPIFRNECGHFNFGPSDSFIRYNDPDNNTRYFYPGNTLVLCEPINLRAEND